MAPRPISAWISYLPMVGMMSNIGPPIGQARPRGLSSVGMPEIRGPAAERISRRQRIPHEASIGPRRDPKGLSRTMAGTVERGLAPLLTCGGPEGLRVVVGLE